MRLEGLQHESRCVFATGLYDMHSHEGATPQPSTCDQKKSAKAGQRQTTMRTSRTVEPTRQYRLKGQAQVVYGSQGHGVNGTMP